MEMPAAKRGRMDHHPHAHPSVVGGFARPAPVNGSKIGGNGHVTSGKAVSDRTPTLHHYHLPKCKVLPVYKYSTAHQSRSWDDMITLFRQFVEREGHGDVERNDRSMMIKVAAEEGEERGEEGVGVSGNGGMSKAENGDAKKKDPEDGWKKGSEETGKSDVSDKNTGGDGSANLPLDSSNSSNSEDDEDEALMLRSWVREVRWVIRADGLGQDDKFPRGIPAASAAANDSKRRRCDSETITPERLSQLQDMPEFPLLRNNRKNNNDGDDSNGNRQHHPNQHRSAFGRWIDDLMHYRAKNGGDSNVPLKYVEHPGLGNFVNRQRTEYRKLLQGKASSMTRTKIRELDRVDFTWSVREGGHASWESRLDELRDYQRTHGHTNVPKNHPPNPSLGYWVNEQRFQYRRWVRGKSSYMNPAKMSRLNSLGFKWTLRESKRPWEDWMGELRKYGAEHGHVNVPLKYDRNVPLGSFVNNQRSEYRRMRQGKQSSMTEEKVQELEKMGFLWNVRDARTPWNVRLEELRQYKEKHGDCNVPNNWPENQPLSSWVSKQRQQYKLYGRGGGSTSCHLTEVRVNQLNELGFDWRYPSAVVPKNAFVPPPAVLPVAASTGAANAIAVAEV